MRPNEAVIAVTLGCNSRCVTCDLWRHRRGQEMEPGAYRCLPRSLTHINLSGGEPYLREDLPEIYAVIREQFPRARVVVSTNGLMPERIERMTARMPGLAVRVSLDAVGPANDAVRGVPGSYEKSIETLKRLRDIGVEDLGVSATASRGHSDQLSRVLEYAYENGWEFVCSVTHSSKIYFGSQDELIPSVEESFRELEAVVRKQLASWKPKEWFRAYMTAGMMDYIARRPRRFRCTAIRDFFYLDPAGVVYPCNMRDDPMGKLTESDYEEIVRRNPEVRRRVETCEINCWMSCTVAPTLRRRPWIAIPWIVSNKLGLAAPARRRCELAPRGGFSGNGERSAGIGG